MRKQLLLLLLMAVSIVALSDEKEKAAELLAPEWEDYVVACENDSTLQVWWEYTGEEKAVESIDSTSGTNIKVVTLMPTRRAVFVKKNPTWEDFMVYIGKLNDD